MNHSSSIYGIKCITYFVSSAGSVALNIWDEADLFIYFFPLSLSLGGDLELLFVFKDLINRTGRFTLAHTKKIFSSESQETVIWHFSPN